MIPYFGKRIPRPDQFRKFYNDTALYGNTDALMLGYAFFGVDHILFGTDAPLGPKNGLTWQTMKSVEAMSIPDVDKEKIFILNAIKLLRLSI
jgi:predicted TIM-barrel fold metal-dependent hydrolase